MDTRALGTTGAKISALCMGCWEIGGLAWGPVTGPDAQALVRHAFDAGITTFDTAEAYGNGRSEVILGRALQGHRDEVVIITKTGYLPGIDGAQMLYAEGGQPQPQDYSAASIRRACELSLRRLESTYIDVYLLHDPPMHVVQHEGPFEELQRLQAAGKIRWWGVSAQPPVAAEAIRRWGAQVVETPFNAVNPEAARDVFPVAQEHGAAVLARSPFASGLLLLSQAEAEQHLPATDWRRNFAADRWARGAVVRQRLDALADRRDEPSTETAIRFVLGHVQVSTCIVGLAKTEDVAPNLPAASPPYLTSAEIAYLTSEGAA